MALTFFLIEYRVRRETRDSCFELVVMCERHARELEYTRFRSTEQFCIYDSGSTPAPAVQNPDCECDADPNVCITPQCLRTALYQKSNMDEKISPCEDFYSFACGHFEENNPQTYILVRISCPLVLPQELWIMQNRLVFFF